MKYPERVRVITRDRETGLMVGPVALVLTLFAARKNDYRVGPVITDDNRRAEFSREECEFSIRRAKEMFLMDYYSSVEERHAFIEVELYQAELVGGMIRQYRAAPEFWGLAFFRSPEQLFAELAHVKNGEYNQAKMRATEKEILANPVLELLLSKKVLFLHPWELGQPGAPA
jgi:hypothetical protein